MAANFLSIRRINELMSRGELTLTDLFDSSLSRANEIKHLNAFISINREERRNVVRSRHHPLYGVPYALKDNFSSKHFPTTCASRMLQGYKPTYDATVLQRLSKCGAVLVGKMNMDEFAMGSGSVDSIYGPVKNPWTPGILDKLGLEEDWRTAGGSSGGSAVAVATGSCVFALGSDSGGSVRNPASYCGIVGLKPTYGLVSRHGLIPLVNSMDCPSIFARSVEDAAIVLDAIKGRDVFDSTTVHCDWLSFLQDDNSNSLEGFCVGIPKECLVSGMTEDVVNAWKWAADQFEKAGAEVVQVSLPHMRYSIICYHILCSSEVASNMARFDGLKYGYHSAASESLNAMTALSRKYGFNDTVRSRILVGNYFLLKSNQEKYFHKAQKVRRLILQDYEQVFGLSYNRNMTLQKDLSSPNCDVLLSPVVLSDAPLYSDFITEDSRTRCAEQDVLTQSANMAGVPAITVPTCLSSNSLPIGLQITGKHFSEPVILKVASFLEKLTNFPSLQQLFERQSQKSSQKR